ncbi:DUF1878 family protein [Bacillus sp. B15-48]|uniref:DUF1878 family protein n=1 Tax=Bacillus sp. B15-48 TaxID=1548601 RepID=UPI00193EE36F|nr:DUF1878 family protein [Bacillus sp. B15-48]MBM4764165.1 DUF1878 family protein [Bacillus sp. B15-48]
MSNDDLMKKINMLEYHQKLLLKMVGHSRLNFYYLIIENSLSQEEADRILMNCENLSKDLQKQKAEGFVYFHPLYKQFKLFLEPKLNADEVIAACLEQGLYVPLMQELKKYSEL